MLSGQQKTPVDLTSTSSLRAVRESPTPSSVTLWPTPAPVAFSPPSTACRRIHDRRLGVLAPAMELTACTCSAGTLTHHPHHSFQRVASTRQVSLHHAVRVRRPFLNDVDNDAASRRSPVAFRVEDIPGKRNSVPIARDETPARPGQSRAHGLRLDKRSVGRIWVAVRDPVV